MFKKPLSLAVLLCFLINSLGPIPKAYAQGVAELPVPGTMVNLSEAYVPILMKGLKVHPENPFKFDFIMDTGNDTVIASEAKALPAGRQESKQEHLKAESNRLIKYFLAALTVPEKDLWVNLSPYEKDRMIADNLGQTEMGRDMLAQDYILKQLTASLIYPEKDLGKDFWNKVYAKAQQMYGSSEIPVNTFNKVWIVADKADIFERNNVAYVVGAHLKVMLEEDYTALNLSLRGAQATKQSNSSHTIASQIVREIILPEIEREVNEGKNFAPLRQMFYSMILASWFKMALKDSVMSQMYGNQSKLGGLSYKNEDELSSPNALVGDPKKNDNELIYERYLQAYKKGVFNYIKEDLSLRAEGEAISKGTTIPRKYFSGGLEVNIPAALQRNQPWNSAAMTGQNFMATVNLIPTRTSVAMTTDEDVSAGKVFSLNFEDNESIVILERAKKYVKVQMKVGDEIIETGWIEVNNILKLINEEALILKKRLFSISLKEHLYFNPNNPALNEGILEGLLRDLTLVSSKFNGQYIEVPYIFEGFRGDSYDLVSRFGKEVDSAPFVSKRRDLTWRVDGVDFKGKIGLHNHKRGQFESSRMQILAANELQDLVSSMFKEDPRKAIRLVDDIKKATNAVMASSVAPSAAMTAEGVKQFEAAINGLIKQRGGRIEVKLEFDQNPEGAPLGGFWFNAAKWLASRSGKSGSTEVFEFKIWSNLNVGEFAGELRDKINQVAKPLDNPIGEARYFSVSKENWDSTIEEMGVSLQSAILSDAKTVISAAMTATAEQAELTRIYTESFASKSGLKRARENLIEYLINEQEYVNANKVASDIAAWLGIDRFGEEAREWKMIQEAAMARLAVKGIFIHWKRRGKSSSPFTLEVGSFHKGSPVTVMHGADGRPIAATAGSGSKIELPSVREAWDVLEDLLAERPAIFNELVEFMRDKSKQLSSVAIEELYSRKILTADGAVGSIFGQVIEGLVSKKRKDAEGPEGKYILRAPQTSRTLTIVNAAMTAGDHAASLRDLILAGKFSLHKHLSTIADLKTSEAGGAPVVTGGETYLSENVRKTPLTKEYLKGVVNIFHNITVEEASHNAVEELSLEQVNQIMREDKKGVVRLFEFVYADGSKNMVLVMPYNAANNRATWIRRTIFQNDKIPVVFDKIINNEGILKSPWGNAIKVERWNQKKFRGPEVWINLKGDFIKRRPNIKHHKIFYEDESILYIVDIPANLGIMETKKRFYDTDRSFKNTLLGLPVKHGQIWWNIVRDLKGKEIARVKGYAKIHAGPEVSYADLLEEVKGILKEKEDIRSLKRILLSQEWLHVIRESSRLDDYMGLNAAMTALNDETGEESKPVPATVILDDREQPAGEEGSKPQQEDSAMSAPGGIDFDRAKMQMNVKRDAAMDAAQPMFKIDPAMIADFKMNGIGLEFTIETIVPITNLPLLLGLRKEEENEAEVLAKV